MIQRNMVARWGPVCAGRLLSLFASSLLLFAVASRADTACTLDGVDIGSTRVVVLSSPCFIASAPWTPPSSYVAVNMTGGVNGYGALSSGFLSDIIRAAGEGRWH